jgi:TetR/AcrR family transcriptional repressor of nem operon
MIRVNMVGRPKEFDEQQALEKAMVVFWTHGYEATSVQDLLDAMGINRGSMYDTFGDKHALFSAAIDHYGRTVTRGLEDTLAAPGSPLANIRKALMAVADLTLDRPCRGCMATNTAVELAQHDPKAGAAVTSILQRIEKSFHGALRRAVEAGELGPRTNTRASARFLTGTLQGVVVMGKASSSRATLKDIIAVAMTALE